MNFGHLELLLLNWLQQRRAFVLAGWFVLLQVQDLSRLVIRVGNFAGQQLLKLINHKVGHGIQMGADISSKY